MPILTPCLQINGISQENQAAGAEHPAPAPHVFGGRTGPGRKHPSRRGAMSRLHSRRRRLLVPRPQAGRTADRPGSLSSDPEAAAPPCARNLLPPILARCSCSRPAEAGAQSKAAAAPRQGHDSSVVTRHLPGGLFGGGNVFRRRFLSESINSK